MRKIHAVSMTTFSYMPLWLNSNRKTVKDSGQPLLRLDDRMDFEKLISNVGLKNLYLKND